MISRVYTVLMPTDNSTAVDIPVESTTAQTTVGTDGFYSEWRNRTLRVPIKAGSASTPNTGFVPRFRLGFSLAITQHVGTGAANLPTVRCSRSLVGNVLSAINGTTTQGDGTFQDPNGAPTIRVVNSAAVGGLTFRLYLLVMEAKDDAADVLAGVGS